MKLLIISHTPHYIDPDGTVVGWGSTVMEIDQLAKLFTEVTHLAPLYGGKPPDSSLPYTTKNLKRTLVKPAGGERLFQKISYLWRIPQWLASMKAEIRQADAIHIRCPAGISLIGLFAARLWAKRKPVWVKYAGNWQPHSRESLSYTIQRYLLLKNFQHGIVTVNGKWDQQPDHVVSFNNPSFSRDNWLRAQTSATHKQLSLPLQIIFVGRVEEAKGIAAVIQIASQLALQGLSFTIDVIGDGPSRNFYENSVKAKGLSECVLFHGWKSRSEIVRYYERAHFILLPSTASEGWPKVLSEAMAYGVVPLASNVSSIPQILSETKAGHAFPPDQPQLFVDKIVQYTLDTESWKTTSLYGVQAADLFTYETYLNAVRKLFFENWGIDLNHA